MYEFAHVLRKGYLFDKEAKCIAKTKVIKSRRFWLGFIVSINDFSLKVVNDLLT